MNRKSTSITTARIQYQMPHMYAHLDYTHTFTCMTIKTIKESVYSLPFYRTLLRGLIGDVWFLPSTGYKKGVVGYYLVLKIQTFA